MIKLEPAVSRALAACVLLGLSGGVDATEPSPGIESDGMRSWSLNARRYPDPIDGPGPREKSRGPEELSSRPDFSLDFSSLDLVHLGVFQDEVGAEESASPPAAGDSAAEMARKLQNPLANIKAVMTDNDILFGTGDDETSYSFQIQPVYAIDFPDNGFSLVLRGVIPVLGIAPESDLPIIGETLPDDGSTTWGLGDIVTQAFFAPKTDKAWKIGFGPQISLRTRTDSRLGGPGWGAGPAVVLVGSLTDDLSLALVAGNLWGDDGFNVLSLQPMLYFNLPSHPGSYVAYNAQITYNWDESSSNALTLPLGAVVGRTFDLGSGHGLDLSIGAYWNVEKPDGANDWQIKFGVSWVLP